MLRCPKCQAELEDDRTICPRDGVILLGADDEQRFAHRLASGTPIAEYVIDQPIGCGTFGDVYRAMEPKLGRRVAIKVLNPRFASDAKVVSRFMAEARAASQIHHPNIVEVLAFGTLADGRHFQVMPLLEGHTLEDELRARGRLSPAEALAILGPLASALSACHAAGVVHRDLKPANVFLVLAPDGSWAPTLLDFGIAKLLTAEIPREHRTATGARIGTPYYMSPEQCGGPDVDHKSDIYAFGVLAYEMLTGSVPFRDSTVIGVLYQHTSVPPEAPSQRQPALDPAFDPAVLALLAKRPEARPASIEQAFQRIAAVLGPSEAGATLPTAVSDTLLRAPSPPPTGRRWLPWLLPPMLALLLWGLARARGFEANTPAPLASTAPVAAAEAEDAGLGDTTAIAPTEAIAPRAPDAAVRPSAAVELKNPKQRPPPARAKKGPDDLEDY